MNVPSLFVIFILLFIWLGVLSFFFFKFYSQFANLSKSGKKESVMQIVEETVRLESENKKTLDQLVKGYAKLEKDGSAHIQKIGLVRFNPFKDTGGDQSFILALVDSESTGVVISSLHTRTGTRWYAKAVVNGKGVEYDLSDEEEKALKGAKFLSEHTK